MALACAAAWRLAPAAAAAAAAARRRRLPALCRAASSQAAKAEEPAYSFDPLPSEAPVFPELLEPGRRVVLLAVDPDLGGAVAALSWRNPPAAPEDGGSSSSSVGGDGLLPLPAGHQLQVEVHDMPLEVWRYGTGREKRQPDAAGLINILRRYGGAGIGGGTEVAVPASSTPAHSTPKSSSGSGKKRGKRKAAAEGDAATADAAPGEAAAALAEPSQQPDPDAAAAPPAGFALEEDEEPPLIRAVMEYNMPAQLSGKYAWYGIGFSVGLLNGLLSAAGVPYHRVHASTWKAAVGLRRQGKEGSLALARHLLPAAAGLLKRKKDHGRAEALLIAAWGLGVRMRPLACSSSDGGSGGGSSAEDEGDAEQSS